MRSCSVIISEINELLSELQEAAGEEMRGEIQSRLFGAKRAVAATPRAKAKAIVEKPLAKPGGKLRSKDEITKLGGAIIEALTRTPWQTLSQIAEPLGLTAADLRTPAKNIRDQLESRGPKAKTEYALDRSKAGH